MNIPLNTGAKTGILREQLINTDNVSDITAIPLATSMIAIVIDDLLIAVSPLFNSFVFMSYL